MANKWFDYDVEQADRQEKWDRRYLELAKHVSTWSKDPSTKVGVVLVSTGEHQREFIGYNGFPRGVEDTDYRLNERDLKYQLVVHAEVNAILKAGDNAMGATLYVYPSFSLPPICNECAKVAIQAGIKIIVGYNPDMDNPRVQRWAASINTAKTMCQEAGITWRAYEENL
jgi:dCMP deaminase